MRILTFLILFFSAVSEAGTISGGGAKLTQVKDNPWFVHNTSEVRYCIKHDNSAFDIDYINAHGTSTPAGDIQELKAVREVFGDNTPAIASTKSLSGHSLGAAGVQEAIYSLLMMENDFIAASANVESLDEGADGMDVVQEARSDVRLNRVMSNSFGFGGTNATLVFQRFEG